MEAAQHRCQCAGACRQPHTKGEGRYGRLARHQLVAAALPASELRAWGPPCFTAARRAAQRATAAPGDDQGGLFDL
ncbi:hypothetical protein [Streptomyces sp. NPDC093089]|uniref:hypothetical protein n=1 Tax=Streptomyces sp. NPDC093089 TaxID=3366024 RepID=UPI0038072DC4